MLSSKIQPCPLPPARSPISTGPVQHLEPRRQEGARNGSTQGSGTGSRHRGDSTRNTGDWGTVPRIGLLQEQTAVPVLWQDQILQAHPRRRWDLEEAKVVKVTEAFLSFSAQSCYDSYSLTDKAYLLFLHLLIPHCFQLFSAQEQTEILFLNILSQNQHLEKESTNLAK